MNEQLKAYIDAERYRGVSDELIKSALTQAGWKVEDVDFALQENAAKPIVGMSREEAHLEIKELGKFKASWALAKQSWSLLVKDKEIVWFPIISASLTLIISIAYGLFVWISGLVEVVDEDLMVTNSSLFYVSLLVYYVSIYFVTTFFKVGLTAIVYERINGGDIGFNEGIQQATNIFGKIFLWSLIAGTIGLVLRMIAERSKALGRFVVWLLGAAWSILTFFIAPTLLLDKVGVIQSIKNSGNIFRKTWGETLITTISLSVFTNIVVLLVTLGFVVGSIVIAVLELASLPLFILVGVAFFISLLMVVIISTTLSEIFKVALYCYARFGIIADGFSPAFIVGAVKEGEKKK
jgi:hypothetical protein